MWLSFLHGINVNDVGTHIFCFPHIGTCSELFETLWFLWVVTVNWTTFVSMSFSVFIPLTVSFKAEPCKPSLSARLSDTQELLQAVSHKAKALVLAPKDLVSFNSVTWRKPLTSVTDDKVFVLFCCWRPVAGLLAPAFDFKFLKLLFVEGLAGKILSAPWCKVLLELLHLSYIYGTFALPEYMLITQQEKQSFASATTLALCVEVFSLKTRLSLSRWLPFHRAL